VIGAGNDVFSSRIKAGVITMIDNSERTVAAARGARRLGTSAVLVVAVACAAAGEGTAHADSTSCMNIAGAMQCTTTDASGGSVATNCSPSVGESYLCTTSDGRSGGCYTLPGGFLQCSWSES